MQFDTLVRYKALDHLYSLGNRKLLDRFLEDPAMQDQLGTRKIQFDAISETFSDLEEVVGILNMSKREFLEAAVSDALEKAHQIINEEGLTERLEYMAEGKEGSQC